MAEHNQLGLDGAHGPYRKVFADAAERTGDTGPYLASDVTQRIKALQADTNQEYVLTNHSPVTWTPTGGGGAASTQISASPSASQDDYSPTGWDNADMLVLTPTTPINITGFAKPTDSAKPHRKTIVQGNGNASTLKQADAGSAAANRIRVPGGADLVLAAQDDVATIEYDDITDIWRVV